MTKEKKSTEPVNDQKIVESLNIPLKPLDNKVLIKPLEPIKVMKEFTEPDDKKNKGKKSGPKGDTMDVKKVQKEVNADVRKGVVLALPDNVEWDLNVGDTVVYWDSERLPKFDLYRDSIIIFKFDIIGKWDSTKEKDSDIYGKKKE